MVSCAHCQRQVPPGRLTDAGPQFCCSGCESVYRLLNEWQLGDFYHQRDTLGLARAEELQPPPEGVDHQAAAYDSEVFASAYVAQLSDGSAELTWAVGGLHCAACVWLLEQLPRMLPGVISARANFADNTLRVWYQPDQVRPSEQAITIARLGYRVAPPAELSRQRLARRERRTLLLRTALSGAAAMGTMHLAVGLLAAESTGSMSPAEVQFYGLVSAVVALPALLYGAWPFYRGALQGILLGRLGLDAAVAAVMVIGGFVSLINMLRASTAMYFDALAMFVAFLLAGRVVLQLTQEAVARRSRRQQAVLPLVVRAEPDGAWLATDSIMPGQRCWLQAGETLPVDATVAPDQPAALFDTAVLTGESRPQRITNGGAIPAGAVLISPAASVVATTTLAESRLGRLLREVQAGRWQPTPLTELVDRIQAWFTPVVLVLALVVGGGYALTQPHRALDQAIAIILVCCPCALGLATPLCLTQLVLRAAGEDILVDNASLIEALHRPATIVLDKTGTITTGQLTVSSWTWHQRLPGDANIIDQLEAGSAHPIARAVQDWLAQDQAQQAQPLKAQPVKAQPANAQTNSSQQLTSQQLTSPPGTIISQQEQLGSGLSGIDDQGREWRIGNAAWIGHDLPQHGADTVIGVVCRQAQRSAATQDGIAATSTADTATSNLMPATTASDTSTGTTDLADSTTETADKAVASDSESCWTLIATISLHDPIRPGMAELIHHWRGQGSSIGCLSGDRSTTVAVVAQHLQLDWAHGDCSPANKASRITNLPGPTVMIGDGLNDAPALQAADAGIVVSGGVLAGIQAGDAVVVKPSAQSLQRLWQLAAGCRKRLRGALAWAIIYNLIAAAAVIIGWWGPLVCAIAMPLSSLLIVAYVLTWRSAAPTNAL